MNSHNIPNEMKTGDKMKKILAIFHADIRSIITNWTILIVVLGLLFLPALYAWLNIKSSWDPYSHTNTIPIGIVNNDKGAIIQNKNIQIGKKIIDSLREDKSLGWKFTNEAEAKRKVEIGEYYACVIIPENFSQRITTVLTDEPIKPEIIYYVNEKTNAIAPKITTKGASSIVEQVSKNFVKTSSSIVLSIFNELGIELEQELPTIQKIKQLVFWLEDKLPEIENMTELAITDAKRAENIINSTTERIAIIEKVIANGHELDNRLKGYLSNTDDVLHSINPHLKQNLEWLLQQERNISAMIENMAEDNEIDNQIILDRITNNQNLVMAVDNMFQQLNAFTGSNVFQTERATLARILTNQNKQLGIKQNNIPLENVQELSTANEGEINDLIHRFDSETSPKLDQVVVKARNLMVNYQSLINQGQRKLNEVQDILQHTKLLLKTGSQELATFQSHFPEVRRKITEIANKMREFDKNHDLHKIISLLRNDINKESDFLAEPVLLTEHKMFPIPNYGSAMSPFFTTLALWFAGLVLVSILSVNLCDSEKEFKPYQIYIGRYLIFFSIGILQSCIITVGDVVFLHTYVASKFWFYLFSIFIATVFGLIIYTLVSIFGNVGKAICVILLVLQISSSGGTFPVQVTPAFFQAINPYLPFTYAISLLRETVGGIVWSVAIKDLVILFLFFIMTIISGVLLKKPLLQKTEKLRKVLSSSRLMEHD